MIGQVGDSRVYLLRDGALQQLTKDHSYVQEQVDAGFLTPEQARYHPYSNVITRCVGASPDVQPDIYQGEVRLGDLFLVASDGLTGMVDDRRLQMLLMSRAEPERKVHALISEANGRGGLDNITAIVVQVAPEDDGASTARTQEIADGADARVVGARSPQQRDEPRSRTSPSSPHHSSGEFAQPYLERFRHDALARRARRPARRSARARAAPPSPRTKRNKANWELAEKFSATNLRSRVYTSAVNPRWLGQSDSLCYDWKDHNGLDVLPRRADDEDEEAAVRSGEARGAALGSEPSRARSAEPALQLAHVLEGPQDLHVQRRQLAMGVGHRDGDAEAPRTGDAGRRCGWSRRSRWAWRWRRWRLTRRRGAA